MNKRYLQKFAKHLKTLRKEKGLVQDDFDCSKISRSMYAHVELATSDITLSKIKAIADIMGVHPKSFWILINNFFRIASSLRFL